MFEDDFYKDISEEDFMKNPNLYYERPAAYAGLWFYYIFPWQENTPWLFDTGSGDSEQ